MKKLIAVFVLFSTIIFIGCGGGGGSSTTYVSDSYYGWYDYWGYECGMMAPGCNYDQYGYKAWIYDDPWSKSMMDYYYSYWYHDYVYESPSGIIYDEWGRALNQDNEISIGRDIITNVERITEIKLKKAASYYAEKFNIANSQALKLAKTLNDFALLKNRSINDLNDFSKRLYGVDLNQIQNAVEQNNMTEVISEAATNFNTTPENMRNIIKSLHGQLLKEANIVL